MEQVLSVGLSAKKATAVETLCLGREASLRGAYAHDATREIPRVLASQTVDGVAFGHGVGADAPAKSYARRQESQEDPSPAGGRGKGEGGEGESE
jgi:hypothetical protein